MFLFELRRSRVVLAAPPSVADLLLDLLQWWSLAAARQVAASTALPLYSRSCIAPDEYAGAQLELVHQDKPHHGARHIVGDLVKLKSNCPCDFDFERVFDVQGGPCRAGRLLQALPFFCFSCIAAAV